jgi:hypothetical protein
MNLKQQLTQINLKKAKFADGNTVEEIMAIEAQRLYRCIKFYIDRYYNSYEPRMYDRNYWYQGALYPEKIIDIRVKKNTLVLGVNFNSQLSMHPNFEYVISGVNYYQEYPIDIKNSHDSFVPILMEKGWYAPRLEGMIGKSIYRLTRFDGIHAVEKGISDFNKTNKYGIKVDASNFFKAKAY